MSRSEFVDRVFRVAKAAEGLTLGIWLLACVIAMGLLGAAHYLQ